jgi:hypothetical protein
VWGEGGAEVEVASQQLLTSVRGGEVWLAWRPVVAAPGVERAVWVLPTPGKPKGWRLGSGEGFDEAERLLQLRAPKRPGEAFGARVMRGSPGPSKLEGVKIEVVPGSGEEAARVVAERLEALGHEGAADALAHYAERGWRFTLVDARAPQGGDVGGAWPVLYGAYEGDRAVFPVRSFVGRGAADTRWYVLTEDRLAKGDLESARAHGFSVAAAFGSPGATPPKAYPGRARPYKASVARLSPERSPANLARWMKRAGWGARDQAWVRVFYREDLDERVTLTPEGPEDEATLALVAEEVAVPAARGERIVGEPGGEVAPAPAGGPEVVAQEAAPAEVKGAPEARASGGCGACATPGEGVPVEASWLWVFGWIGWRSRKRFAPGRDRIDSVGNDQAAED